MRYGKTNSSKLSKLHLPYSRGFLWKMFFFNYLKFFRRSCTLSRRAWAFSWEKAGMVVKTVFFVSRSSFFLLKIWNIHKYFYFLYLQRKTVCENFLADLSKVYLYAPHFLFWGKKFSDVLFFSGILNKNFVPFDKRNWAKLSKLLFLSPENQLSCFKNLKMHKRVVFSYLQQEGFCENFWQTCRKCTCLVHSNILKKNYFSDQLFFFFLGFWV